MSRTHVHRRNIRFPHHTLAADEMRGPSEIVSPTQAAATPSPSPEDVSDVPQSLRRAGVGRVILVHGTFAGDDVVGIVREVARFSPGVARQMNELGKRWFDEFVGEVGNYTDAYADCLAGLINPPNADPIPVTRFHWSGENHHLGRADGVMSLVEMLGTPMASDRRRILVMAHSHGGNVIAMLSQIIGASAEVRRAFFDATRMHYQSPICETIDINVWKRARDRLLDPDAPHSPPIDVATFGTPLRYRWNTDVCPKLLHFVQHRPSSDEHPQRACLPGSMLDVMAAAGGDYIQHLGIAGTDFLPSVLAWRDWVVERRMCTMFESTARRRDVWKKLRLGRRESSDGTTLLVDYPETPDGFSHQLFGHGVYTCHPWLPYHLREIASRFYGSQ